MSDAATAPEKIMVWSDKPCDCGLDHPSIYINDKVWNKFDEATMKAFKKAVFQHYRAVGERFKAMGLTAYPHIIFEDNAKKTANQQRLDEINELLNYTKKDRLKLIYKDEEGNTCIGQTMHALGFAWSYFPHWTTAKCNEMRTPQDTFEDNELFKKVIDKRIMWKPEDPNIRPERNGIGTMVTDSGIRKSIKMFTGTQAVSNFRPSAACAIYEVLLPAGGSVVWDMSMGWGGRMIGAFACDKVSKYIGCDPETRTFAGLEKLRDDLKLLVPERQIEYEIYCYGSETSEMRAVLPAGSVDLCFTSPPYFDCEKYGEEATQSWKKYTSTDAWLHGFMKDTMRNCKDALKPGGTMAINIADVSTYKGMQDFIVKLAEDEGWIYERIPGSKTGKNDLRLTLSAAVGGVQYRACEKCQRLTAEASGQDFVEKDYPGNWKKCFEHKYKYEPIFVFRKPF